MLQFVQKSSATPSHEIVMVRPSRELVAGFIVMAGVLATGFVAAVAWTERRRGARYQRAGIAALATLAWLTVTGVAANAGVLRFEARPPGFVLLVPIMVIGSIVLARSELGARLAAGIPLAVLVGWQGFRLPLELLMHRAYREGLMPVQMSYSGMNFDILTGASALILAGLLLVRRAPLGLVRAWNVVGLLLLLNVMTIALLSAPTPIRVFHNQPANVWVTRFPFVWLPTVMVATALLGHLIIFRRLGMKTRRAPGSATASFTGRAGPAPAA
jgi:hypothetical protein